MGLLLGERRSRRAVNLVLLGPMSEFPTEAWWTMRQRTLVDDRSRQWREQVFRPSAAVEREVESRRITGKAEAVPSADDSIIAGGWDHDHCALCWVKISAHPGDEPSGFTDGNDWVCRDCFSRYLEPRIAAI